MPRDFDSRSSRVYSARRDPYTRDKSNLFQKFLNTGNWISNFENDVSNWSQADALRSALRQKLTGDQLAYWDSLNKSEQDALLKPYYTEDENDMWNLWGLLGSTEYFDEDLFLDDIRELNNYEPEPLLSDYVNVNQSLADAQASIDAENEKLLASLNEDLQRTGDAYSQARNDILTSQHQRNAQTIDTMMSDMSRARRNAIEAGASAGVRIAGNVNALLSAQNKMSQQSLETSNQLAQMLLSQRNAESGLRNQWRDAQMSTYDRMHSRAANEMSVGQQKYDLARADWQSRQDSATSDTNLLGDSIQKYRNNNRAKYSTSAGSAY